ncbi:hypothetical protein E2C01_044595 [Portunus trituberculatus]|uniref:Uncharacterized protein n=1 Tax=Portunus trituberculatus TaxID=210409 RepID=A0A5B7G2R8_PORTR|nr:hypothetical protein [Portunus trituberculatus]
MAGQVTRDGSLCVPRRRGWSGRRRDGDDRHVRFSLYSRCCVEVRDLSVISFSQGLGPYWRPLTWVRSEAAACTLQKLLRLAAARRGVDSRRGGIVSAAAAGTPQHTSPALRSPFKSLYCYVKLKLRSLVLLCYEMGDLTFES